MPSLTVPFTSYTTYDLTDSDVFILDLLLNFDSGYHVLARSDGGFSSSSGEPKKVKAIKWWRTRFPQSTLREAKDAVDTYYTNIFAGGK